MAKKCTMRNDVSLGDHGYFHFGGAHLHCRLYPRWQGGSPGQPSPPCAYTFFSKSLVQLFGRNMLVVTSAILKCMLVSLFYIYIYIYEDRENPQLSECKRGRTWASAQNAHTEK